MHSIIKSWYRASNIMRYELVYDMEFQFTDLVSLRIASFKENPNHVYGKNVSVKLNAQTCAFVRKIIYKCSSHYHPSKTFRSDHDLKNTLTLTSYPWRECSIFQIFHADGNQLQPLSRIPLTCMTLCARVD